MSLLNYWQDYIKGKIETLTNDMNTRFNSINNFTLKKYKHNVTITNLGSDSKTTNHIFIDRNNDEYFLGIESITLSEQVPGNIQINVDKFFIESRGGMGYWITIINNTGEEYNGTVTVNLVFLAKA